MNALSSRVRLSRAFAAFVQRHRVAVVVAALLGAVAAGLAGAGVADRLTDGGLNDPASESARLARLPGSPVAENGLLLLYTSDAPAPRRAVRASLAAIPPALLATPRAGAWRVSADGRRVLVPLVLASADPAAQTRALAEIRRRAEVPALAAAGVDLRIGGGVAAREEFGRAAARDLERAELIAFPLLLVALVVVFRGVVAALLPLLLGGLAVLFALAALRALTHVTEVSALAQNVVTMLGLGLAVDYALFVVSRFREELAAGRDRGTALARTLATAGHTVAVSGTVVTVSLAGLLCFPLGVLRSVGMGAMAVTAFNVLAALTVLPALLALLGERVNALPLRAAKRDRSTLWVTLVRRVTRRPVAALLAATAVLLLLGVPFLHAQYGSSVTSVLPEGAEARQVAEAAETGFPDLAPFAAVAVTGSSAWAAADYASAVRGVPGVTGVNVVGTGPGTVHLAVAADGLEPGSGEARRAVEAIRALPEPGALVGGRTAELIDDSAAVAGALPWMGLTVVLGTGLLLLVAFRSSVIPVKALVVGALSLTASLGVLVWGFQDGALTPLLGFDPVDSISTSVPVLVLAITFGLSMDYEMFLLSRVRETWLDTGDNGRAITAGVRRTGGIITSAAVLLLIVTLALAASEVVVLAMIGVGLSVGILLDATLVRLVMVPAALHLMGGANWRLLPRRVWRRARTGPRAPRDDLARR